MNQRKYECVFIARQDLSRAQVDGLTEHVIKLISDQKGVVHKNEYCGLRQLAYVIGKNKKGHYVELHIEATPEAIFEMERNMKLNGDILRFLTIVNEGGFSKAPSQLSQTKGFREKKYPVDANGMPIAKGPSKPEGVRREDRGFRQTPKQDEAATEVEGEA